MNIDWSKAPEGATHWDTGVNFRVAGWMKLDDGIWYWWPVKDSKCDIKWHASLNQHMIRLEDLIPRPSSWNGEGPPPVGTVCEYVDRSKITRTVEVLALSNGEAWLLSIGDECESHSFITKYLDSFRPIRTPEQIAVEDRDKAINQMEFDTDCLDRGALSKLYDAGWRKINDS